MFYDTGTYMYMYSEFFYYFNLVRTFVETSAIDYLSVYVKWVYVFYQHINNYTYFADSYTYEFTEL